MSDDLTDGPEGDETGGGDQERATRESRLTGGDAEAAGSIEEREAIANDTDDAFSGDEEE